MINIDPREFEDRMERVRALQKEDEKHFVNLVNDSIRESYDTNKRIRNIWSETWSIYQNEQNYADKEEWQSAIVIPKAFSTIQQAKGIIRKAMATNRDFYQLIPVGEITPQVEQMLEVARRIMSAFQSERQGNFPIAFVDAAEMGFVTGQSMEMIPQWRNGTFNWELVEPWKVYRDPNAKPRDPNSGNYWVHEEYIDMWILKELEKQGKLKNIADFVNDGDKEYPTERHQEVQRKGQYYTANKHFKAAQVREYWGTIVDKDGELLLPSGYFMVSGEKIIKDIVANPYKHIKWPGISFTPIPHLTRFEGRGILEGVVDLFIAFNNLLNLHMDNLNWNVNPPRELSLGMLNDPQDDEIYPGKVLLTNLTASNTTPALRVSDSRSSSPEVLANGQYFEKMWQNSTFVSEFLEGLPGTRSEITKGEVELKTEAGLGVFNSMAKDLELGAQQALWASYDIISYNLTLSDPIIARVTSDIDPSIVEAAYDQRYDLYDHANISITGISNLIKRADMLKRIEAAMIKAESPTFGQFFKPHNLAKAYSDILDLDRYEAVVSDEEAQAAQQQSAAMAQELAAQEAMGQGGQSGRGGASGELRKLPEVS